MLGFRRIALRMFLPVAFLLAVPQEAHAGCTWEGVKGGFGSLFSGKSIAESYRDGKEVTAECKAEREGAASGGGGGGGDEGEVDEGEVDEGEVDEGEVDEGEVDEGEVDEGEVDEEGEGGEGCSGIDCVTNSDVPEGPDVNVGQEIDNYVKCEGACCNPRSSWMREYCKTHDEHISEESRKIQKAHDGLEEIKMFSSRSEDGKLCHDGRVHTDNNDGALRKCQAPASASIIRAKDETERHKYQWGGGRGSLDNTERTGFSSNWLTHARLGGPGARQGRGFQKGAGHQKGPGYTEYQGREGGQVLDVKTTSKDRALDFVKLAKRHMAEGDFEKGIYYLLQAYDQDPKNPLDSLPCTSGMCLLRNG